MGPSGLQEPGASGSGSGSGGGDTGREGSRGPIMIAVVGKSGAGKTSFINAVTGMSLAVGHNPGPLDTQDIQLASTTLCGRPVTFIDTPGFAGDLKRVVSQCLQAATSEGGAAISGVIYLHPITDPDAEGSSRAKLGAFRKLCGNKFQNVVLCTTMWDKSGTAEGAVRERRLLREGSTLWRDMFEEGGLVGRHQGGPDSSASARGIAETLVKDRLAALRIQVGSENKAPQGTSEGMLRIGGVDREERTGEEIGGMGGQLAELWAATTAKDEVIALMEGMKRKHTEEVEQLKVQLWAAGAAKDSLTEAAKRKHTEEVEQLRAAGAAKDALMEAARRKHTEEVEQLKVQLWAASAAKDSFMEATKRKHAEEVEQLRVQIWAANAAKDSLMEAAKRKHMEEVGQLMAAGAAKDALMDAVKRKHKEEVEQLRAQLWASSAAKDALMVERNQMLRRQEHMARNFTP